MPECSRAGDDHHDRGGDDDSRARDDHHPLPREYCEYIHSSPDDRPRLDQFDDARTVPVDDDLDHLPVDHDVDDLPAHDRAL